MSSSEGADTESAESTESAGRLPAVLARVGLRGRLLAAIMLVAVTTLAVGLIGINRMSALSEQAQAVYDSGTVPVDALRSVQVSWWEVQAHSARAQVPSLSAELKAQEAQKLQVSTQELADRTAVVEGLALSPAARDAFAQYQSNAATYFTTRDALRKALAAGDMATMAQLLPTSSQAESGAQATIADATAAAATSADRTAQAARDSYLTARTVTVAIIVLGLVVSLFLATLIVRAVTRPVRRVREVLDQVAAGDLSVRVGETGGAEIGEVARSLDQTLDALSGVLALVSDSAGRLAGASRTLNAGAAAMAESARTATSQADVVVASAGEVAASVDTVATGSQQMESAIREIAHNATEAARVAGQAVDVAESTTRTVGKLGDSSQEIAAVVKLINGIAEQTNLLALNATIEAARAGEAGKGFAVVASEVKELAQETARATEDISQRVEAIQADTAGAVEAIGEISAVIGQINDYQATIAAAVEEQTATTNEMNRNVAEAASSSRSIATAISGLAAGTQQTNEGVADAQRSAAELARMSDELQGAVRRFTV
jgi:methyl-accepting chemotaxis protein